MRYSSVTSAIGLTAALASCSTTGDKTNGGTSASAVDSSSATGVRSVQLPVVATSARDGDLVLTISTTGLVRSEAEGTLKAEVGGTVIKVPVRPGDRVQAGAPLVVLDPRPFDLAVREAQIAVDDASLKYEEQILTDSIVSRRSPEASFRRIVSTRSGLSAARVRLERAQLDRERAVIVAPFGGVVDRVTVTAGERVSAGQDVTTVVDVDHLRIEAAVLEHDLPLIRVGGEALITSAAAPNRTVTGRVIAVLPRVDSAARAGRAFVRASGNGVLRPGMYADVRLEASRLARRRLVPAKAVIERDGRPLVFVVKDGRAQWTYINPGRSNGRETEVLPDSATGLIPVKVGDQVIVEGHLTLTHDAPVRVIVPRETPRESPRAKP
ncbi:MAG: hypothetical protein C0497_13370 [Gemmatimonas sp.]|nr:hypothetical protein [Gemmatimonas sp.]